MKKDPKAEPLSTRIGVIPVNLTLAPVLIQPVATLAPGAAPPPGLPIMREGFISVTGLLPCPSGPTATAAR